MHNLRSREDDLVKKKQILFFPSMIVVHMSASYLKMVISKLSGPLEEVSCH